MATLLFVSYSGAFGGAERVLLDCIDAVPGESLLACPEGPLADRARAAGVAVFAITPRRPQVRTSTRDRLLAPARLIAHSVEVRALVSNLEPDAVIAWGMRSGLACALGRPLGRPLAFAHNDMLPTRAVAAAVRAAATRAMVVVVPSRAVATDLDPRGTLDGRLWVVAPGVDLDRFRPTQPPARPAEVIVLGALVEWKRPDLALEACALARATAPELRLRLVGAPLLADDPMPELLRLRAAQPDLAGAVEFAGDAAEPELELARATCLLHCAPNEPFGLVVAEALAAGRPVVVADAGGPAEIVDGSCALLYPPGDAAAAARAIVELVCDPALARVRGEAGRRRAVQHLSRARSAAGFARALAPLSATPVRPSPPTGMLALVTVSHNSERELGTLLDSAREHLPGAQVVVVDSGSSDASVGLARRRPWATTVALDDNVGFGRACNSGLQEVMAPVVAFVNPDVELLDDSLLALASEALRTDRPQRLLAPLVLSADGSRQDTVHPVPASAADLAGALVSPTFAPRSSLAPWKYGSPRRVGWAVGCALVARTETFRRLGPFDESIFLYGEDLDLCLRAAQAGVETWFWPRARVLHHRAHSSIGEFGGEPYRLLARARHDVVRRRLGAGRARLDDAAQAATFASRLLVKRALGRPADREHAQLAAVLRRPGP